MLDVPLHFLVIHFPIALALVAVINDVRGSHRTGYVLSLWTAAGAGLAVLTGLQLGAGPAATAHAALGLLGTISWIALAILRYSADARQSEAMHSYPVLWLVLELFAAALITAAAFTGHRMALGAG